MLVSTYSIAVCSVKLGFNKNLNILGLLLFFGYNDSRFLVVIATKKVKNLEYNLTEDNDIKIKDF